MRRKSSTKDIYQHAICRGQSRRVPQTFLLCWRLQFEGRSGEFITSLGLKVSLLCVTGLVGERIHENITAVLGEDVYLSCTYVGESEIQDAEWKRQINSKMKSKRLAGFFNGEPFSRDGISKPDSLTNLTVKMKVSSVEVEGEYICEFEAQEEPYYGSVHLTVVGKSIQQPIIFFASPQ